MMRGKGGQSILEYTLVLGAIIAVLVIVLLRQGGIKDKVQETYNKSNDAINRVKTDLAHGVFGADTGT